MAAKWTTLTLVTLLKLALSEAASAAVLKQKREAGDDPNADENSTGEPGENS